MKQTEAYINLIVLNQIQLEYLDVLKGTRAYHQKVKNLTNQLTRELEKCVDNDFDVIASQSEEVGQNISLNLEQMIKKFAKMDSADIIAFNQLYDMYTNDKEGFIDRNPIYMKKVD